MTAFLPSSDSHAFGHADEDVATGAAPITEGRTVRVGKGLGISVTTLLGGKPPPAYRRGGGGMQGSFSGAQGGSRVRVWDASPAC